MTLVQSGRILAQGGMEETIMGPDEQTGAILVVDDDAAVRGMVKAFLEGAGYTVVTAADGADGLTFFKRHQSVIALILTDVAMPNMNGLDLADRVLELNAELPILFMSGSAHHADRGFGCMAKPFRGADLLARIGAMLKRTVPLSSVQSA
jgi:DNA-binding response OmpR family regulator